MMGRPELGGNLTCAGCHECFYDLNRSPAICPKCGAQQLPARTHKLSPPLSAHGTRLQPRQPPAIAIVDEEVEQVGTADMEAKDDVPGADDESGDDIEIDPDLAKTPRRKLWERQ